MLMPGAKKTHRSYVWAYTTSQFCETAAVVYDFSPSRAGEHARNFLQDWKGKLACDDFGGYKASFELGVTEIGMASIVNRSGRPDPFGTLPYFRALDLEVPSWEAAACPLCREPGAGPAVKPGSRPGLPG